MVDAPRTGAGKRQIEEGKTEKHGRFATSEEREKATWGVHHEASRVATPDQSDARDGESDGAARAQRGDIR